jgi:hypothetical protein
VVVERPICGAVVRLALVVVQARHARPSSSSLAANAVVVFLFGLLFLCRLLVGGLPLVILLGQRLSLWSKSLFSASCREIQRLGILLPSPCSRAFSFLFFFSAGMPNHYFGRCLVGTVGRTPIYHVYPNRVQGEGTIAMRLSHQRINPNSIFDLRI